MRSIAMLTGLALLPLFFQPAFGQCKSALPPDPCLGTEPAPVNNEIMTVGVKKWYYGPAATINQLTLRGGTLVVCTDLTINNLVLDSGTIVINPGAKLTAGGGGSGMIWQGGCAVYNYGRFEITTNLNMQGPYASATRPNILMNASSSSSSRSFNYLVINDPNSSYVNYGTADFGGIITDNFSAPGSVCLGSGSILREQVLINKIKDTYAAPSGNACLSVSNFSQFLDTLTNYPTLLVCIGPSHTSQTGGTNKPNAWGEATKFTNCTSCANTSLLNQEPERPRAGRTDQLEEVGIRLYPNPFMDVVQIGWPAGKKPEAVMILSQTGQVVYQVKTDKGMTNGLKFRLPALLPNGEYIAKLIYRNSTTIHKLIKISR